MRLLFAWVFLLAAAMVGDVADEARKSAKLLHDNSCTCALAVNIDALPNQSWHNSKTSSSRP